MKSFPIWLTGATAVCAVLAADAAAQSRGIEEIVVTARKRAESLQDAPITVSAFTAATMERRGLEDITEIALQTPQLSYHSSFGRHFDRPTIRGMSNILGDANAGNFIDGIFVSGSVMSQETDNLERVEVIKGPQAALYGRATFAGAINFITKSPSEEPEGKASATIATRDQYEISASHSGPLIADKLGYFVSARYYERGNQYKNIGTGGPKTGAGGQRSAGGTVKLRATPTDAFTATLRVSYADDRDSEAANALTNAATNNCFLNRGGYICGQMPIFETVNLSFGDFPDNFLGIDRQTTRGHLILEYDFGPAVVTSNSAYNIEKFYRVTDADYTPRTAFGGTANQRVDIDYKDYSQELRIAAPADQRFRWLLGGYYFHLKREENRITYLPNNVQTPEVRPTSEVDNFALFGSLEYDITESLTATAELRRGWDRLKSFGSVTNPPFSRRFDLSSKFKSWSPRFILKYALSEETTFYASLAKGNKPGGFNAGLQRADAVPSERDRLAQYIDFEEESSWNYEIGAKNTFLDGNATLNVAAFYIDWSRQQLTFTEPVQVFNADGRTTRPVNISLIQNAGSTEIYGLEVEASFRVSESFDVTVGYGYTHAEFKEFNDPTQLAIFGVASVAGNEPPRVPNHKFVIAANYVRPITDSLRGFVRVNASIEESRFDQVQNLLETGDTTRLGARIGIETDSWEIALWGKNLTADKSAVDITRLTDPFAPGQRAFLGLYPDKRQFGLTGTLRF
jgi:outer membrane receptor protein involved in Fe transport